MPEAGLFVQGIVDGVRDRVAATVQPRAIVAGAEAFSFPRVLVVAVLVFLIGQWRMDDPKFRLAPLSRADTTIVFEEKEAI